MDLLAKPMQRLTRYSLLLKAILKKTDNPEQYFALDEMVSITQLDDSSLSLCNARINAVKR